MIVACVWKDYRSHQEGDYQTTETASRSATRTNDASLALPHLAMLLPSSTPARPSLPPLLRQIIPTTAQSTTPASISDGCTDSVRSFTLSVAMDKNEIIPSSGDDNLGPMLIGVNWAVFGPSTIIVGLRLLTRIWITHNFGWDDAMILFAQVKRTLVVPEGDC